MNLEKATTEAASFFAYGVGALSFATAVFVLIATATFLWIIVRGFK